LTLVKWSIPFSLNSEYPPAKIEKILENNYSLKIIQNPAKDFITVDYNFAETNSDNLQMNLYDITGKIIKSTSIKSKKGTSKINCSGLHGFYILKVTGKDIIITEKVIVEY